MADEQQPFRESREVTVLQAALPLVRLADRKQLPFHLQRAVIEAARKGERDLRVVPQVTQGQGRTRSRQEHGRRVRRRVNLDAKATRAGWPQRRIARANQKRHATFHVFDQFRRQNRGCHPCRVSRSPLPPPHIRPHALSCRARARARARSRSLSLFSPPCPAPSLSPSWISSPSPAAAPAQPLSRAQSSSPAPLTDSAFGASGMPNITTCPASPPPRRRS